MMRTLSFAKVSLAAGAIGLLIAAILLLFPSKDGRGQTSSGSMLEMPVAVVAKGRQLYIADMELQAILMMDLRDGSISEIARFDWLAEETRKAGFVIPDSLAATKQGLFVALATRNEIGGWNWEEIRKTEGSLPPPSVRLAALGLEPTAVANYATKDGVAFLDRRKGLLAISAGGRQQVVVGPQLERCRKGADSGRLCWPDKVAGLPDGSGFLIVEGDRSTIRRVSLDGVVTEHAGVPWDAGVEDGPRGVGRLRAPAGIRSSGLFGTVVADAGNCTIRSVSMDGDLNILAGIQGKCGFRDGPALEALFDTPVDVEWLPDGDLVIADTGNRAIRILRKGGTVETIAVGSARRTGDVVN